MKKLNVYVDMDGVIADFFNEPNAVERFRTELNFFKNLKVINGDAFKQLLARKDFKVFVITKSPHEQADRDKLEWLKEHFPQVKKKRVIFVRLDKNKSDNMATDNGILLDDYGKNCIEWEAKKGNRAIKVVKPLFEHFNEFTEDNYKWGI